MNPLTGSDAVDLLATIRDYGPHRIRHRISGEDLVLETDHRRCEPLPGDKLGAEPREFFQVIVGLEANNVVIRARHVIQHRGMARLDRSVPCPMSFTFPRAEPGYSRRVGQVLARILKNPRLLIPDDARKFPRTGWPATVET
jgi:hypothetical protein